MVDLKDHYNLDEISDELNSLRSDLNKAKQQRDGIKESVLTYKEYLELFGSVSDKLRKTTDMALIDGVLRIFFSNFTVKQYGKGKEQRCEITHKLKEPWAGFLNDNDFSCGRLVATLNEPMSKTAYIRFYAIIALLRTGSKGCNAYSIMS